MLRNMHNIFSFFRSELELYLLELYIRITHTLLVTSMP